VAPSFSQEEAYAETRLTHLLSQANPRAAWNNFVPEQALASVYNQPSGVTVPSAFFSPSERQRPFYCFVHGFNISHDSSDCWVMSNDVQYTAALRTATSPVGTGGNPNVDPLVSLPYRFLPLPTPVCASKFSYPLLRIRDALASSSNSLIFLHFPPFFVAKPLPQVPFTLPDGSCLEVGCHDHITGELTFPHKLLPVSVYFLPPSSLSHSLFGVSPLIRPHGHAVFDNQSCSFFDSPQAPLPFLTGTKADQDDLWFLQVPSLPEPQHSPSILFPLQELPHAKFVAYWHRAFGSPSLSTFLDALSSDFIHSIPRLTPALVQKYPPPSLSTSYDHLDTLRQGIASTRKPLPSPSVLSADSSISPTLSRLDRRRQLFLDDCDDHDVDRLGTPASISE
jgi:hypothetical protein